MSKTRVSMRQLRLPFISYYVTVVDPVKGTTVSVVDASTWRAMVREHRERILRVEHKSFEYGLVANLVLRGEDGEGEVEPPGFRNKGSSSGDPAGPQASFEGQNHGGFGGVDIPEDPARSEGCKARRVAIWIMSKLMPSEFAKIRGCGRF